MHRKDEPFRVPLFGYALGQTINILLGQGRSHHPGSESSASPEWEHLKYEFVVTRRMVVVDDPRPRLSEHNLCQFALLRTGKVPQILGSESSSRSGYRSRWCLQATSISLQVRRWSQMGTTRFANHA